MTVPASWPTLPAIPPINEYLMDLSECVCQALEDLGAGATCWCGVYPGENVEWNYCGSDECDDACGMAYVRLVRAFPSVSFPIEDVAAACKGPLAYELEVGVLRCFPGVDENGELPEAEIVTEAALLMNDDQRALRIAMMCCESPVSETALSEWNPVGPSGVCHGGFWKLYVAL